MPLFYTVMETPIGPLWLISTPTGLCRIGLPGESRAAQEAWLARCVGPETMEENPEALAPAVTQLREYFSRLRRRFDLPLDLRGTPFQRRVWEELLSVPYGQTISYGELARRIGKPEAVRAVGQAVGANPVPIIVPCHRVIGADGSLVGYGGGLEVKAALLRLEGALPLAITGGRIGGSAESALPAIAVSPPPARTPGLSAPHSG
ncbi:MAG: methylated-DNA--[protein]-cysteine S-methyltransferase [Anaerolineae bacterium]|nr:methylated-DNA--[protein]-cysteine S-methyltransferase [Anaerolineae bacterium]MCX8067447.1 methylated-DNA--[protein]-cysteine S-methyltransferase [Anaerolineae bacterium]MDW7992694.1 methylated-DNA--[protein]-cysteine S-methyltransferase [Anaerolineae bacterium]